MAEKRPARAPRCYFRSRELEMSKGIQRIFSEVSQTYELANRVLTLGMDTLWRKQAAKLAVADGGTKWMDVCSGTGETAVHLGPTNRAAKGNESDGQKDGRKSDQDQQIPPHVNERSAL